MHMRVFVVLVAMTTMILGLMNDTKYTSGLNISLNSANFTFILLSTDFVILSVIILVWSSNFSHSFWYIDSTSYEVRGRPMSQPKSSSSAIGTRAYFYATVTPAILLLEHVTPADSGIYWCRVDFLRSATRNYMVNLTVITPPNRPTIIDERTQHSIRLLEPYNEGDKMKLLCEVNGGIPRPSLIWYLENTIIDETFEEEDNGVTSNALTFTRLGREHLNARLSCQASNTNLSPPPSKVIIININLRPLSVQIVKKEEQLSAYRSYDVECIVTGSRPAPQITWSIGSKPLRDNVINFSQSNLTRSIVQLVPEAQDHERLLICHAENPHLRAKSLEDTWKLAVQYVPIVSLKMRFSKKSNHIAEGDDVYLECTARANPRPSKFFWFKQDMQIEHNASAGVFVSEQSLLLQNVIRNDSGEYTCAAQNDEGKATSNPVNLQVTYPPVCISSKNTQVFVVLEKETIELTCEVSSSPPPKHFMWSFNNSKEYMDIDQKYYKSRGSKSTFLYTPSTEEDFGVVSCLAVNTAGLQDEPCSFILVAPTIPTALQNCSVLNQSFTALQVECQEGSDGGLTQVFHMEVLDIPSLNVLSNVTSNISLLAVTGLPERTRAHYLLILYASNAKGRSEIETLYAVVSHNRLTELHTPLSLSPMLESFVAIVGFLTASICVVLAAAYCRHRTHNNRPINVESSEHDDTYTASPEIDYSRQFALEVGPLDNPDLRNGNNIEEMEMFAASDVLRIRGNRDSNVVPSNYTISVVDCGVTARGADIAASHGPNVHESHI